MSKQPEILNTDEQAIETTKAVGELIPANDLSIQLDEVSKVYGDSMPYQRDRVVNEVKFLINQTAEGMLEIGRRLVLIKEYEADADFINIAEKEFNLSRRTAYQMMQASIKFLNLKDSSVRALAHLGKAKIFDLIGQDNDELEALAEGGTVAGLTLDEMDKMTTRELKAALREAKETESALRKMSAEKTEKIEDLNLKLEKTEKKRKKLELEVDTGAELLTAYKDRWLDISKQLNATLCDSKAIITKALEDVLPAHFLQQIAIELSDITLEFKELLTVLPSDTTPLNLADEDWDIDGVEVAQDESEQ